MKLVAALEREWGQYQKGWPPTLPAREVAYRKYLFFAGGAVAASEVARDCDGELSALYEVAKSLDPCRPPEPEPFSMAGDKGPREPSVQ